MIKIILLFLMALNLHAGIVIEGAIGSQNMKANNLNSTIDNINDTSASKKMPNYESTFFSTYAFSYKYLDFLGSGIRYDNINSGIRQGDYDTEGGTLSWRTNLKSKIIYLTTDYYLHIEDFLITFGVGIGYSYNIKFSSEYVNSNNTSYPDSKVVYENKSFSYILKTTYSWLILEIVDIFLEIGYRYLNVGAMNAKEITGNSSVAEGDPFMPLENSTPVDFKLSGYYLSMGLRVQF